MFDGTEYLGTAVPAWSEWTWSVGDRIRYINAAAGAAPGSQCTTGGAGGTAVFKAMAHLAA